jgi:hypothetical protein
MPLAGEDSLLAPLKAGSGAAIANLGGNVLGLIPCPILG